MLIVSSTRISLPPDHLISVKSKPPVMCSTLDFRSCHCYRLFVQFRRLISPTNRKWPLTWKKTRPRTQRCLIGPAMTKQRWLPFGQKATLKRLRFEFWTYEYGHLLWCVHYDFRCADNLCYSCPIIYHQICKCRFMQVRRSSLVGIKRQGQARGVVEQAKYNNTKK